MVVSLAETQVQATGMGNSSVASASTKCSLCGQAPVELSSVLPSLWQGCTEFNAKYPNTLSPCHMSAASGGRRGSNGISKPFPTHFSASFSNMKLKPGTVNAHLVFGFCESAFLCCCGGEGDPWWSLLSHHLPLPSLFLLLMPFKKFCLYKLLKPW